MAADCELPIRGSTTCGVLAIGRCARCKRAFCESHRAQRNGGFNGPIVDECSRCHANPVARAVPQARLDLYNASILQHAETAAKALDEAGVPTTTVHVSEFAGRNLIGRTKYTVREVRIWRTDVRRTVPSSGVEMEYVLTSDGRWANTEVGAHTLVLGALAPLPRHEEMLGKWAANRLVAHRGKG